MNQMCEESRMNSSGFISKTSSTLTLKKNTLQYVYIEVIRKDMKSGSKEILQHLLEHSSLPSTQSLLLVQGIFKEETGKEMSKQRLTLSCRESKGRNYENSL